jgi:hypothetical protein
MSKKQGYSPNDQRSVVKNPNNPAYWADRQNRIDQGHPTRPGATPLPPSPADGSDGKKPATSR